MCLVCLSLDHDPSPGETAALHGWDNPAPTIASGFATVDAGPAAADVTALARHLTTGFWRDWGQDWRRFDLSAGQAITVDLSALAADGRALAERALAQWTDLTGITFQTAVGAAAQISFDDNQDGAFASSSVIGNTIVASHVNISTAWVANYGTLTAGYGFQTYMHEIGHALGLGHAGNYNGTGDFATQAINAQDSWQASVMSYFSQGQNPNTGASFAWVPGLMAADLRAVEALYGLPDTLNGGATVWGIGANAGAVAAEIGAMMATGTLARPVTLTIVDRGGVDRIDVSADTRDQRINLTPGTASSVYGLRENLLIDGRSEIEQVRAGAGNDSILGNRLANLLEGGAGNDRIEGGAGHDSLNGGAGNDTLAGGEGNDGIAGGTGDDALFGGDHSDVLAGGDGDDNLIGGLGNDRATGDAGADSLWGAEGNDSLLGGAADDWLAGDNGQDALLGGDGDDALSGGAGGDRLLGDAGNDWLSGGDDGDILRGGDGNDALQGDAGNDLLCGEAGQDSITGDAGNDALFGGVDSDTLDGGDGADRLSGGVGNDLLLGGAGDDALAGEGGDDTLNGGDGADSLSGGGGNDRLEGGAGADSLTGSGGADTFVFADVASSAPTACDVITDFRSGSDRLALDGIDAQSALAGDQAFVMIGTAAFTAAGQLRTWADGQGLWLAVEVTGDSVADLQFLLAGVAVINAADLIL